MTDSPQTCFDLVKTKATGLLDDNEIEQAFERYDRIRNQLIAAGKTDNLDGRIAERLKIDALNKKREAAQRYRGLAETIRTRVVNEKHLDALKAQGIKPLKAIRSLIEGVQQGVAGARVSVYRAKLAYEARYLGRLFAKVHAEKPHVIKLIRDRQFDEDVTHEMWELRKGGSPGSTKNKDAQWLAELLHTQLELARTEANARGASIGMLDGYSGVQVHDDLAMISAGFDKWFGDTMALIDRDTTFPELNDTDIKEVMLEIFTTITTGVNRHPTEQHLLGQRVNPANLAKRFGKSRVLHFKGAAERIRYRDTYGFGSTVGGIVGQLRHMAKAVAAMDTFGPNPDVAVRSLIDRERRLLREQSKGKSAKEIEEINKQIRELEGGVQSSIDEMTGYLAAPHVGNVFASAALHNNIRQGISMSKLGGVIATAIPGDTVTAGAASMFRGSGFWNGIWQQFGERFAANQDELKEIAFLTGEGLDGLTSHIAHGLADENALVGSTSGWANRFFQWSGLTRWTDSSRAIAGRTLAAELGMHSPKTFDQLPNRYRHVLRLHGIEKQHWDAIRQASYREVNGNKYITSDKISSLSDDLVAPIVSDEIGAARLKADEKISKAKTQDAKDKIEAKFEKKREKIIQEGRRNLEIQVAGFIADETNYAIVEVDAAARRTTTLGLRPGTAGGEAIRYIMQFKGYPITFAQRVLGRSIAGGEGATKGQRFLNNFGHLGSLVAGMTVAGYLSMTMKDAIRGHWPPRNPLQGRTLAEQLASAGKTFSAAMVQGGGMGIYGDFLFAQQNRFGHDPLTSVLGPGAGAVNDFAKMVYSYRDLNPKATEALNFVLQNTPFLNLFYVRPVLDVLFINSLREWASPGFIRRKQSKRKSEYGQGTTPQTLPELIRSFKQ